METKVLDLIEIANELERISQELEAKNEWSLATSLINVKISLLLYTDRYDWERLL